MELQAPKKSSLTFPCVSRGEVVVAKSLLDLALESPGGGEHYVDDARRILEEAMNAYRAAHKAYGIASTCEYDHPDVRERAITQQASGGPSPTAVR